MSKDVSPMAQQKLVLPVIDEQVRVGVRRVDTGRGVRIHKTVAEHSEAIAQTLQRDQVTVKRVAVGTLVPLSDVPQPRQEGDTWIVPVLEEVVVVEKRLRIKEELHITRTAQAHAYTGTVVLRSEQVTIERFDEASGPDISQPNGGTHHGTHTRGSF